MVDEAKFFEGIRTGEYNLPKSLRGLFILAVNNQDERFLVVRMYSRPTTVELAVIVVNAVARLILGRGLSLVANAMVTRVLGIVTGPIGMTLTALWLAADLAGPAYRVTIPAVIYLAAMREIYRYRRHHDAESIAA